MTDNEKSIRQALANGPTPGPWINAKPLYGSRQLDDDELQEWYASDNTIYQTENPDEDGKIAGMYDYEKGGIVRAVDAAYIAAVNPATVTELLAELNVLRLDAKRYQWLTNDHADLQTRHRVSEICDCIQIRSRAHTSAAIDAALAQQGSKL